MRVISGKNKGLKLISPKADIRPTLDRVKEAVFNVIQFKVAASKVLDLFAGSGAYGIEAHSRGAESVIFNDNSDYSCNLIRQNCNRAGFEPVLHKSDFMQAIRSFASQQLKFDIIFVDAPYGDGSGQNAVRQLLNGNLLNECGVIVYEHSCMHTLQLQGIRTDTKKYGKVFVDFIYKLCN